MMDASQRTSCILPAGNPPAGHICICHEKSCFLDRGSPAHSVPDTVTTSPRPGLPGRLKGSAKSFRSWKASLLLPEAWLDRLAQPGCPKWRWTSVLSLMVSGARHRKTIVFFFCLLHNTVVQMCLSSLRCATAPMATTESCLSGGRREDFPCHLSPVREILREGLDKVPDDQWCCYGDDWSVNPFPFLSLSSRASPRMGRTNLGPVSHPSLFFLYL